MSSAEGLLNSESHKCSAVIATKKEDRFENADCWYIEDCDHDHSTDKNALFLSYYYDCNNDCSLHKNVIFLSLYRTMIMIAVLFMMIEIMITSLTKMSYFLVFTCG